MSKKLTFEAAITQWWSEYKINLGISTICSKKRIIESYLIPRFGDMILRKISTELVQNYVDSLSTQPKKLATSTIKSHGKVLRQFFKWAVTKKHIKTSPVDGVKFPKVVYPEIEVFDTKEIPILISAARPKWLGKAIEIAFRTGMRRGGSLWSEMGRC